MRSTATPRTQHVGVRANVAVWALTAVVSAMLAISQADGADVTELPVRVLHSAGFAGYSTAGRRLLQDDTPLPVCPPFKDYSPFGTWTCYGTVGNGSCRCPDNMRCEPIEGGLGRCVCGSELCDPDQPLCLASAADPFDNQCAPAGTPALPACAPLEGDGRFTCSTETPCSCPMNQECIPFEGSPSDGTMGTCVCGRTYYQDGAACSADKPLCTVASPNPFSLQCTAAPAAPLPTCPPTANGPSNFTCKPGVCGCPDNQQCVIRQDGVGVCYCGEGGQTCTVDTPDCMAGPFSAVFSDFDCVAAAPPPPYMDSQLMRR